MDAAARWKRLVRARRRQMDSIAPGRGAVGPAFWDARARRFAAAVMDTAERDPFLDRVRRAVAPSSTVLDVGAGPGRFTLALAPEVREVVAVDSSPAMLRILKREARGRGLANIRTVNARWEDAAVEPAGVTICSYVVPMIEDLPGFAAKLDAATNVRAFVYMSGTSADLVLEPLWRHFHGTPRTLGPSYLDAAAVLKEMGIAVEVEIVEVPTWSRYRSLAEAVRSYRETLMLPDTPEMRREVREVIRPWLVARDGYLAAPISTMPGAILSWKPRRSRRR